MKLLSHLLLLTFIMLPTHSFSQNWDLVWSDEFETPGAPDPTKWSFDVEGNSWDWGNNELQNYTPADSGNAWVENGNLIIEARKEKYTAPQDNQERDYTSARLRTLNKGDWLHGKFEIKAKMPKGKGTWPAIWMLNSETNNWPHSGELDIMEAIGSEPGKIYSNVWCTNTEAIFGAGGNVMIDDPFDTYHLYSMEWHKDTIKFYVDSTMVTKYGKDGDDKAQWPFTEKFHLLLNIAIGGDWEGSVADSTFNNPVRMYVDYVRVYQQSTPAKIKTDNHKETFNFKNNTIEINAANKSFKKGKIDIYSVSGRLVKSKPIDENLNNKLNLSSFSKGSYIALIDLNHISYRRKIIIQ